MKKFSELLSNYIQAEKDLEEYCADCAEYTPCRRTLHERWERAAKELDDAFTTIAKATGETK